MIFVYQALRNRGGRADPKVEQNLQNLEKCSTAAAKFRVRDIESRTKSSKIEKMFYSVTFAKNSVVSDYGQILKIAVCPQRNLGVPPGIRKNPRHHWHEF
ncbi:hypothetical protein [Ligilactobacillus ruminis]|uniref:hypothetical protein n=1 Tax=Ligilactobacillus ruminis TaxID=1623 RepID=UPI0022E1F2BB|nr:hypothetical protein [Ligilactobacillus ruminis]